VLDDFLISHRSTIIANTQARVASRTSPKPTGVELNHGIPMFLDQLGVALRLARSSDLVDHAQIDNSASQHGHDLHRLGLTVGQVVHDYGDVCQAITELAVQLGAPITGEEFRTLNLCLDDAIAGAVTAYAHQRERSIEDQGTERLGVLAHELRNLLNSATISFEAIRSGRVALAGSTSMVCVRSLAGLANLIDRSLAEVRLDVGIDHRERISVADFIEEIEIGASMQANARDLHFVATSVDRTVTIEGDRQILIAAVSNLLQNAFKFSRAEGNISLSTRTTADRVLFEIEDECGGLPPGKIDDLFIPYKQSGSDRSGVGLGLSICLKAAKANGGEIHVRDLPGKGCVFTLDLPRRPPPPLSIVGGEKRSAGSLAGGGTATPTLKSRTH
jgi:signal transduction histidine kinase